MTKVIPERKRAEETLEENCRSLRAVIDAVPAMLSAKDRESRYIFMNRYQAELYGITPGNAVGKTASELAGAEYGSLTEAIDAEVLSTNQAKSNYEENWVDLNGHSHSLLTTKVPLRDTMGTPIGIVTVSLDISERVEAEETAGRLVAAIEGLSENFALYGTDEKLVICNENYRRTNDQIPEATKPGILFEDHIRAVVEKGLAPESLGREEEWVQQRLARFRNPGKPFEVARQDGRWLLVHEQRMLDGSTATIATDITERKRIEEALKESEERFRFAFEDAPVGMALISPEGNRFQVNQALADFLGYTVEELADTEMKSTAADLDDLDKSMRLRQQVLDGEITTYRNERRYRHKQGHIVWGEVSSSLFRNEDGEPEHFIAHTIDITERKRIEEALKESEERFRSVIDNSPSFINLKDADGRFQLVNRKNVEMLGLEPPDIVGKSVFDLFPKKGAEEAIAHHRKVLETKSVITEERQAFIKQGTRDFLITKFPILDGSGDVVRIGTIGTDITERRQAEKALLERELMLKGFQDHSPSAFAVRDLEGRFVIVNRTYEKMFNVTNEEIRGKTPSDIFPREFADNLHDYDQTVIETEEPLIHEHPAYVDNDHITLFTVRFPIRNAMGEVTGVVAMATDISERKRAEEASRRLTAAIEPLGESVAIYGADDRLVFWNEAYRKHHVGELEKLLKPGLKLEDLVRARAYSGEAPEAIGREEAYIAERMERHRNPGQQFETPRKDGWFIYRESPTPDGGTIIIITDITEHRQAEEDRSKALDEAERANQAKSEFLAAMSHELRTPLNAILGFADILSHQYFGPIGDKNREYAGDIKASGEHLLELVNEILDLSTIEAGKQSLVKEKLSILEIVTECERIIEDKARSHGIDLVTKVPEDLPPLYADKRAAKQILLNLLSNAVKFTPDGGKVTMSVKASKKNMTLKVADTGKGIPAERLPKLTDPFTRVEGDPYLAEQGWGLGLSITKSLIDLHDGTLDIKSKIGKGTTVTVTFPNGAP